MINNPRETIGFIFPEIAVFRLFNAVKMLKELFIKNFAIIDDLNISFSNGLTILSGETGAGKSIIINAVNLLLGARASTKLIRTGAKTAELEALFHFRPDSTMNNTLKKHGYDASEELLIKRTISSNDRHRIHINGRPATMQLLNLITENLASISGQHAHQGLLQEERQLMILDQFGGLIPLRKRVYKCFHEILPMIVSLDKLNDLKNRQADHIELLKFQQKEISEASISIGEDQNLEQEKNRLKNAETLYQIVYNSIEELYSSQGAIVERVMELKKNLETAGQIDSRLSGTSMHLSEAIFLLEDSVEELRHYLKTIQFDEERLGKVEERMDTLQKLKRKYGGTLKSVSAYLQSIERELSDVENISEKIKQTTAGLEEQYKKLSRLVLDLTSKRKETSKKFTQIVENELATLKMDQTKFQVSFQKIPKDNHTSPYLTVNGVTISESGIDRTTFMIAPNIGENLKPLSSIASGGELSRVVLALKAILAQAESVETVIFDEVDAGIGGSVAEVVGKKLSSLARYHQIICITHLPQIAKFGDHHYRISKHVIKGRTKTTINPLNKKERIKEIARMLGGVKITQATLDHANELLRNT